MGCVDRFWIGLCVDLGCEFSGLVGVDVFVFGGGEFSGFL